ncbi:MAG: tyrosine-type recombinase/integrase [Steroidobacteraceae bacterium]
MVRRPSGAALPVLSLEQAREAAAAYARGSRAASTWRAYEADWRNFESWCRQMKLSPLPATPETVALYLSAEGQRGRAPSTFGRRLAAIRLIHLGARLPSPHDAIEVTEVLRGIRRDFGGLPVMKMPAVDEDIHRMVDAVETHDPQTLRGLRDHAPLLLGYAAALRRSKLAALDVEDLTERPEGLEVRIARSKTDQEGIGTQT